MADLPTDNPDKHSDHAARIVMLVFGKMKDDAGSYWCYVAIKPTEYKRFMELYKQAKMNLYYFEQEGFGEIIVSGQGRKPPTEVTYQVARIYNLELDELYKETDAEKALEKKILQFKEAKQE